MELRRVTPKQLVPGREYVIVFHEPGGDVPWRSGVFVQIVERAAQFVPVVFGSRLDLSRGDYATRAFQFFEVVE